MLKFQGALLREQGQTFALAVVKPHILNNRVQADEIARSFQTVFGCVPIILTANSGGRLTYLGRQDIVRFLSNIPARAIPWKEYTVN